MDHIDFRVGDYESNLSPALNELSRLDFILINPCNKQNAIDWILEACRPKIHEKTELIIGGIHSTTAFQQCWKAVCSHPETSVTIDLDSFGIVFFDKKLQKQNYISPF